MVGWTEVVAKVEVGTDVCGNTITEVVGTEVAPTVVGGLEVVAGSIVGVTEVVGGDEVVGLAVDGELSPPPAASPPPASGWCGGLYGSTPSSPSSTMPVGQPSESAGGTPLPVSIWEDALEYWQMTERPKTRIETSTKTATTRTITMYSVRPCPWSDGRRLRAEPQVFRRPVFLIRTS